MIYTIVPVKNEAKKIINTLDILLPTKSGKIIVVLNGCEDGSLELVKEFNHDRVDYIYFNKPLGVDVPRAVGGFIAVEEGADGVVFVDGDMDGDIGINVDEIIHSLDEKKVDMALTDCYPDGISKSTMANMLLSFRRQLNTELCIFDTIGFGVPNHGPHGISRRLMDKIPISELSIPPVSLALAVKHHLKIDIATSIPNHCLQSTIRDEFHANQMAKTMIGDYIEALQVYKELPRTRGYDGITFTGYHKNRRFDLLELFMNSYDLS